ncbi:MAG: DUF3987 domain-containing protein [Gammaproteobacteria bacterium]|nr:DUF3987 domain-containing protein [Gammaproteobacteria bacterium]
MIDPSNYSHNSKLEELVDILCQKTQRKDRKFFRVILLYFIAKMASAMQVTMVTKDTGEIPVNLYAIALATSGFGKNRSISIIEDSFISQFRQNFTNTIFPGLADKAIQDYAIKTHNATTGTGINEYIKTIKEEFKKMGSYLFEFDEATVPALKQLRQKVLMAGCGSINLQIDEIGSNLLKSDDVLTAFLDLYDLGITKNKLIKSTTDNLRSVILEGRTAANMLLFGTPSKLLDNGPVEKTFMSFLDTGFARRCVFALGDTEDDIEEMTPAELQKMATDIFNTITQLNTSPTMNYWSDTFGDMADFDKHKLQIDVPDQVSISLHSYRLQCEKLATTVPDQDTVKKAEMQHRHFKALKVAGILAFIEEASAITPQILEESIKLVEESADSFQKIIKRQPDFVKLAKYLKTVSKRDSITQADLRRVLPFFTGHPGARNDMIESATEWGTDNGVLIHSIMVGRTRRYYSETLQEADLSQCLVSASNQPALNYESKIKPFHQMVDVGKIDNHKWCNHYFRQNHRNEENALPGFNLVVLDIDGTANRDTVHNILDDYKFITHTTKRHTPDVHRFRLILPIKYHLKLDRDEYKIFMKNLISYLPFECDDTAIDRSRMWTMYATNDVYLNDKGKDVFDPLRFLESTDNYEIHAKRLIDMTQNQLNNIEKWFILECKEGNRNSMFYRYGAMLHQAGKNMTEIEEALNRVNDALSKEDHVSSLPDQEIRAVLTNLAKK